MKNTIKHIVLLFLLLIYSATHSQSLNRKDSLESQIINSTNQEEKFECYIQLIRVLEKEDPAKASLKLQEMLNNALISNDQILIAKAFLTLGVNAYYNSKYIRSTDYYFSSLEHTNEKDSILRLKIYNNIGWNFLKLNEDQKALKYLKLALGYTQNFQDSSTLALLHTNIGVLYKNLESYDSALYHQSHAKDINSKIDNLKGLSMNNNNLGVIYYKQKDYYKSLAFHSQANDINYANKDTLEISLNLINIGLCLYQLNKYDQALDTLKKGLVYANSPLMLEEQLELHEGLYQVYLAQNNHIKALEHFQLNRKISDSIFHNGQIQAMTELETNYRLTQKERLIQQSNIELQNQKQLKYYVLIVLAVALFSIYLLARVNYIKKKNQRELVRLNDEIKNKKEQIESANQNLEKIIANRTSTIQEQNEILRHFAFINAHNLRGPLSRILSITEIMKTQPDDLSPFEMLEHIDQSAKEIDKVITSVSRKLDHDLEASEYKHLT